jgi:uncharacterized protein with HEPN domain
MWRDPKYLLDMLLAARDAESVIVDLTRDQFEQIGLHNWPPAYALQIIGEAAGRVSPQTQELHPEIPWRQMIGVRSWRCGRTFGGLQPASPAGTSASGRVPFPPTSPTNARARKRARKPAR